MPFFVHLSSVCCSVSLAVFSKTCGKKNAKNKQFAIGFSSLEGQFSVILDAPGAHFRSFWRPRELIFEAWGLIWTPWAQISEFSSKMVLKVSSRTPPGVPKSTKTRQNLAKGRLGGSKVRSGTLSDGCSGFWHLFGLVLGGPGP